MSRLLSLLSLALVACTGASPETDDPGQPWFAPDVALEDMDGEEHALSDHLDSTVLLMTGAFW